MASNESKFTLSLQYIDTLMSRFNYSHSHSGWAVSFMTESQSSLLKCCFFFLLTRKQHHRAPHLLFLVYFTRTQRNVSRFSALELIWFVTHVITGHKNVNEETLQSSSYIFLCDRLDTSPPVECTSKRKITGWKWCRAAAKWFASACDICFTVCIWNQLSQLIKLAVSPHPTPHPTPQFHWKHERW